MPFFENANPSFLTDVMMTVKYECAAPLDIVVQESALATKLYIISKGSRHLLLTRVPSPPATFGAVLTGVLYVVPAGPCRCQPTVSRFNY